MKIVKIGTLVFFSFLISYFAFSAELKREISLQKIGISGPVQLGTGLLRTKKAFGSALDEKEFRVMLYPKNGTVGILFKYDMEKHRLLLDKDARNAITRAYENYVQDFDAKKLNRKQIKPNECYGVARCKVEWGTVQYTQSASPKLALGYIFIEKNVYFLLRISPTQVDLRNNDVNYGGCNIYMTRAQALELIEAISDATYNKATQKIVNAKSEMLENLNTNNFDDEGDYEESDSGKIEIPNAKKEEIVPKNKSIQTEKKSKKARKKK